MSPKLLVLLNSFEQTLAEGLKKLKLQDISDVLSLPWLRQAMEFLSETHTNIQTLITDLQFPISDWDEKWVDIYLDSSVKLLDICIVLSSELSRLDQGQLLLRYVLHILDSSNFPPSEQLQRAHASLHDWIQQISSRSSKLENCSVILQGLASSLFVAKVKNTAKGKVLMRVLYGVKVVTVYICSIHVAALSGRAKPLTELHVSDKFLWAAAFNDLQADVNREIRSRFSSRKVIVLKELEGVETCVERLHVLTGCVGHKEEQTLQRSNGISHEDMQTLGGRSAGHEECEKWQESVSDLAGRAERLGHGLDLFSNQVEDFFQIVLTGRDALLCNLRDPDVIMQDHNVDDSKLGFLLDGK